MTGLTKPRCVLPCNGLDKSLGVVAREAALALVDMDNGYELVCPVLLNHGDEKVETVVKETAVTVINGCMTRCATKLLEQRGVQPRAQVLVTDASKKHGIKPGSSLVLSEDGAKLAKAIASDIIKDSKTKDDATAIHEDHAASTEYFKTKRDKFTFKVPVSGYLFNENDCWIKPTGDGLALVGITDFLQNNAGDVLYVNFPEVGKTFDIFDEIGSFESVKTVLDVIAPAGGKIVATNPHLNEEPELMNTDPYGKGWFVQIEPSDLEEDKDLLHDGPAYFEYMKGKIEQEMKKRE